MNFHKKIGKQVKKQYKESIDTMNGGMNKVGIETEFSTAKTIGLFIWGLLVIAGLALYHSNIN